MCSQYLWIIFYHSQMHFYIDVGLRSIRLIRDLSYVFCAVLLLGPKLAASAAGIGVSVKKAWFILAWVSTVAGNWTLVGSAANFIVCEQARHAHGTTPYDLTFWNHLWFGFPSTIVVIAVGLPLIRG